MLIGSHEAVRPQRVRIMANCRQWEEDWSGLVRGRKPGHRRSSRAEIGLIEGEIWIYGRQCKAVQGGRLYIPSQGQDWEGGELRAQIGPEFTNSSTSEAHATEPGNSDLIRGTPAIIRAYVLPPQAINFRGCTACSTDVGRLVLDTVIPGKFCIRSATSPGPSSSSHPC